MTFAHPSVLVLALVLAPALAVAFWASWRVRKRLITRFVPRRLQETLTLGVSPRRAAFRAALLVVGVFFLLVALARPRLGAGTVEVNQRGLDILVGIDTSRSMLAEDAGPGISRLQRAKLAALDLARLARNDRLGLIAFAGSAFLQCPLTIDFEAFRQNIETLDTAVVQQGGTSIGPAIHAAIEAVSDEKENVRVLVLFTDGEDHDSGAVEAARRAATKGLRVFTVGVGTAQGEIIRLRDANGGLTYLKDAQGNVVKSSLNETLLGAIATATGGFYLPLQGPRAMSELFTRAIEPLPKATYQARQMEQYLERFQYPLGFALLLLLWEALFPETARVGKRLRASRRPHPTLDPPTTNPAPAPAASSSAPGIAALLVVLGLVTLASPSTRASTSSALRSYRASEFADAQAEYERLAKSKPADPRLRFNAGAAAYKAGDLDAAARHFKDALASTDLRLQSDTFYNLGNTQFRLGEKIEDPKVRQKAWEQSIGAYEAAVQLAPGHTNAQHNLAYVRQRLEDLKQQQQQQDPQKSQGNDSKDSKDQDSKDDSKSDPQSREKPENNDANPENQDQPQDSSPQENNTPEPSNPSGDGKDSQSPQDPGQDSREPEESRDAQERDAEKPRQGSRADDKSGENGTRGSEDAGAADQAPPGEMTPQQALRLLDSVKGEEKPMPLEKKRARPRSLKDW